MRKLEKERELRLEKSSELREKNNLLNEAMEANNELRRQQVARNEKILRQDKQQFERTKIKYKAVVVDSPINKALVILQKNFHRKAI